MLSRTSPPGCFVILDSAPSSASRDTAAWPENGLWVGDRDRVTLLFAAALVGQDVAVCGLLHPPKGCLLVRSKVVGVADGCCLGFHCFLEDFSRGKRRDRLGSDLDRGACSWVAPCTRLAVTETEAPKTT